MLPPVLPFNLGNGSPHGSENGHGFGMMGMGGGYAGSGYGPAAPRNSVMTNLNMFGGGGGMGSTAPPSAFQGTGFGAQQRPMSTFSLATTMNPFGGAMAAAAPPTSMSENPSDEELSGVLRYYLSTQDLMNVTKKWVLLFVLRGRAC